MYKVKGVNFYAKQIESVLLAQEGVATDYQIRLDRVDGKDTIAITVETTTPDNPAVKQAIDTAIYDMLGFHAELVLVPVGTIERPPGKAVRVVDKRVH